MNYSVHPQAADDLAAAAAFYARSGSSRVAGAFLVEFERAANLLAENPGFGTPFDLPRRTYPLRVFPYSIVYKPTDQGIRVLVVRHQNRAPSYGEGRN